jgi:hypothetical protein
LEQCIQIIKKYRGVSYPDGCGWPKINALKDIRALTGCGLREAKEFLDAVDEQLTHEELVATHEKYHTPGYRSDPTKKGF